jgi:hypothetical protein
MAAQLKLTSPPPESSVSDIVWMVGAAQLEDGAPDGSKTVVGPGVGEHVPTPT